MKWKDHPNLFANGKFRCLSAGDGFNLKIIGYKPNWFLTEDQKQYDGWENVHHCTLIARRIEDMTDEEKSEALLKVDFTKEFYDKFMETFGNDPEAIIQLLRGRTLTFLYVLSIGVYPFDQSHFDTGEVIDIKTINEKG